MSVDPIRNDGDNKPSNAVKLIESSGRAKRRVRKALLNGASLIVGVFLVFVVVVVFTTDISLKNGLTWADFGLVFAILVFCSYSMFVNFYGSGTREGRASGQYIDCFDRYNNLKETIIKNKVQGRLREFCRHFVEEELQNVRTRLLTEVGLSYEIYAERYIGKDKQSLKEDKDLSKTQIATIIKANNTKPITLTAEMILRRGRGAGARSPLGVKPETKRGITFANRFVRSVVTSGITGIIMLDVIINPTWATFAMCCLKLLPVILNGFIGYRMGYENITVDTVGYVDDQSDLIEQFLQYVEQHQTCAQEQSCCDAEELPSEILPAS